MNWQAAVGVLLAVPPAVLLIGRAVRRRPEPATAELGLAVLLLSTLLVSSLARSGSGAVIPSWLLSLTLTTWLVVVASYPDGRIRPRWMSWMLIGSAVLSWVPVVWAGADEVRAVGFAAGFAAGLVAQVVRFRSGSTIADRQAVKWLLVGLVPAVAVLIWPPLLSATTVLGPDLMSESWYALASATAIWLVLWCAAAGLLVGYRWQVEALLRAVVMAVAGTALLVWAYWLLAPGMGTGWAAAVCLLLVLPLARGLGGAADRVVYAGDPSRAVTALGGRLDSALGPGQVAMEVARTVREGIGAGHVVVAIGEAVEAEEGQPGPQPTQWFRVTYQGDDVGVIGASPRPGEAALTARDRAALQRLARSAAASMHAVASYRGLQAAREALVLAREEERRRLRRDLHDDLAPTLAGLSMKAAATARVMSRDPERAAALLTGLTAGMTAALTQVREIAYDLRPPVLDDEGLVAAVRERVGTAAGYPPVVEVVDEIGARTMPAAVELAALRIVQEAVKNVRTHAAAAHCTVWLTRTPGALTVRVADDGVGLRPDAGRGVGLRSIEERAAELGGRVELSSGSGGTTLEVLLPCRGGRS